MTDISEFVYLDNAATTPLSEHVASVMCECLQGGAKGLYGNANSVHSVGRKAFSVLEEARYGVMKAIGAKRPDEIIFTSGATESDNAALYGMVAREIIRRKHSGNPVERPRILVCEIEHEAVLEAADVLKHHGVYVDIIPVNKGGFVEPEIFERMMSDPEWEGQTVLASVMLANNEIGSVQPVAKLAAIAHTYGALFHTDATQALGKTMCDMQKLDVDAASFSAHKVCGPKGVGVLYIKSGSPFNPYLVGGGQERGLRSGTQNVPGIMGCMTAFKDVVEHMETECSRQRALRDKLYAELSSIPAVEMTVEVKPGTLEYLPNIVHVCVHGQESETMILRFDLAGFAISGGSACSSQSLVASHVLRAINTPAHMAKGALRISISSATTQADVDAFIACAREVLV